MTAAQDSRALKSCPFCGGAAVLTKHHREDIWNLIHRCEVIGAVSFDWGEPEAHAARWNRRAALPADPVARTPLTLAQIQKALGVEVEEGSMPYAIARAIERTIR